MPTNKQLADKRHEKLIKDYIRLSSVQEHGKQKHSHEWILAELEQNHHYTVKYIERLLKEKL